MDLPQNKEWKIIDIDYVAFSVGCEILLYFILNHLYAVLH